MDLAAVWTRFTVEEKATVEPLHYAPFRRAGCVAAFALWSIWDATHPITEPPDRAPS